MAALSSDNQNVEMTTSAGNDFWGSNDPELNSALTSKFGTPSQFSSYVHGDVSRWNELTEFLRNFEYNHAMDSKTVDWNAIEDMATQYAKSNGNIFNRKAVKREFINNFLETYNAKHAQQWQLEDLERAGINPLLMYSGGVSSGAQVASRETTTAGSDGFMKLMMMLLMLGKLGVSAASAGKAD